MEYHFELTHIHTGVHMEFKKVKKMKLKTIKKSVRKDAADKNASHVIRSSFFARFRFDLNELLTYLKESSGKLFVDIPQVYQCLDDLGHWSLVRESSEFHFTNELESILTAQFNLLNDTFDYKSSDVLICGDIVRNSAERFLVKVIEKVVDDEQELFRVEVIDSGATFLVSRYELDYWNGAGSSLPVDKLIEVVDWAKDTFWHKRLNDFKSFIIALNFKFNFLASEIEIQQQQEFLLEKIQTFFTMNEGDLFQKGRGIGLLSCGSGSETDRLVVLTLALQALGQPFGLVSRLWGKSVGREKTPAVLNVRLGRKQSPASALFMKQVIQELDLSPMQRSLSEVLKLVLAKGPFGKWEALVSIRSRTTDQNKQAADIPLLAGTDSDKES